MIDKVSKSPQSEDISTCTAARMLRGLNVAIQSMRNTGMDEITARDTDNAPKMDIVNQFPKKRNRRVRSLPSEQANDEGVGLSSQQKFGNDC